MRQRRWVLGATRRLVHSAADDALHTVCSGWRLLIVLSPCYLLLLNLNALHFGSIAPPLSTSSISLSQQAVEAAEARTALTFHYQVFSPENCIHLDTVLAHFSGREVSPLNLFLFFIILHCDDVVMWCFLLCKQTRLRTTACRTNPICDCAYLLCAPNLFALSSSGGAAADD